MATDLKRLITKYVRDRAKHAYNRDTKCFICGDTEELDFHHYHSVTEMLNLWLRKNKIQINSAEDIMAVRDQFIQEHHKQMYEDAVTLCHAHHEFLHRIYGKRPALATAKAQPRWVQKQKEKHDLKKLDSGSDL